MSFSWPRKPESYWPALLAPDTPLPRRIQGKSWCADCGMTDGHWPRKDGGGCSGERVFGSRIGTESDPGAASTARGQATPATTGDDEMNDTRSALGASKQGRTG